MLATAATNDNDDDDAPWADAAARLDEVAQALFEGRYLDATRSARLAAAAMRDAGTTAHPLYAKLAALAGPSGAPASRGVD